MPNDTLQTWLAFRLDQTAHGRHHETLRSQSTNLIVAVSAALLAFISSSGDASSRIWVLSTFLIVINIYGLVMSLKHYERSRLHYSVSRKYANLISDASPLLGRTLNEVRSEAHEEHEQTFAGVWHVRASYLWCGLHALIAAIGILVLL